MKFLPNRKKLPHEMPQWAKQGDRHFITINCEERETNQLVIDDIGAGLIDGFLVYETLGHWFVWLAYVMPDHLHAILTFNLDHGIKRSISSWKGFQAKKFGIKWQTDFF